MIPVPSNPRSLAIPHDEWRPYQKESVEWALSASAPAICEQGTGSGKSAVAAAIGNFYKTVVLTHSKNLQVAYNHVYHFDILFGRSNYACQHPQAPKDATANECLYGTEMHRCPFVHRCEYHVRKTIARESQKTTLNYAYYLMARRNWPELQYLVLDEAHLLPDMCINYAGITVRHIDIEYWNLPDVPVITGEESGALHPKPNPITDAITWLARCERRLLSLEPGINADFRMGRNGALQRKRRYDNLMRKVSSVMEALVIAPHEWYIRANDHLLADMAGIPRQGFVARPLTARWVFPHVFMGTHRLLAMSATIGDPDVLAKELGIGDYETRYVPSQWPPETRPVYLLDAPGMGIKSTYNDPLAWDEQADVIADAIKTVPSNWSGIVHVSRKTEATLLANRLARRGLQGRVWVPPLSDGTERQIAAWDDRKKQSGGALLVTANQWYGFDGKSERICIVAKTPFSNTKDEYEHERMRASRHMYLQRTAWQLEQGLGRTRRGEPGDYDLDGKRQGLVCIADANWTTVKSYLSQTLRDALVEGSPH